jgi:DNA-binding transcriptional LysR family regulator
MHSVNLAAIDLNLLTVFEALLAERQVTRAAGRLGLTQPAVSHALGRLRALFDDPLLVRGAGGMQPTPKALALAPAVSQALGELRRLLAPAEGFVPATTARRFVLGMSDYAAFAIGPRLLAQLRREAPAATLVIRHASRAQGFATIESGEAELIVGNFPHPPSDLAGEVLVEDALVVTLRRGHPALKRRFDLDAYLASEHLNVSLRGEASGGADEALSALGRQRRVVATVGHFLVVPFLLMDSDLVATEPKRVMQRFAKPLDLVLRPPPFTAPLYRVAQMWHRRMGDDAGHQWLRAQVRKAAGAS